MMMIIIITMMMMIMTIESVEQRPGWGEHVSKQSPYSQHGWSNTLRQASLEVPQRRQAGAMLSGTGHCWVNVTVSGDEWGYSMVIFPNISNIFHGIYSQQI